MGWGHSAHLDPLSCTKIREGFCLVLSLRRDRSENDHKERTLSNVLGMVKGAGGPWVTVQEGGLRVLGAMMGSGSLL